MSTLITIVLYCVLYVKIGHCAKILVVVPTPSISHQIVFRPITQELARRGHEVVVITTDPAFPEGRSPNNLTEINVRDISYASWQKNFIATTNTGNRTDIYLQAYTAITIQRNITIEQIKSDEVQKMILKKQEFDLLILEAWVKPALVFAHFFKAPVIQISSLSTYDEYFAAFGAPTHPLLYPFYLRQKLNKLNVWDKLKEFYNQYELFKMFEFLEKLDNKAIWDSFGYDVPPLSELKKKVEMLFLGIYSIWDSNRPVPPAVIYIGGIHRNTEKKIPTDLESYMNASTNGVIYVSFGTNVKPSTIPAEKVQIMVNVFSELPYDILWKWDTDELPGRTKNIKISKWFPQSDLLRHPHIKLFVTQAGLQSTDEAILAGVPLVAIPMLSDQWFNAEMYVKHGLGKMVDMHAMTKEVLKETLETVINDKSYRHNVMKFRSVIYDQPEKPLDRAIWWIEHIIRHGGGSHLRAPGGDMPWSEYLLLDIVAILMFGGLALVSVAGVMLYYLFVFISRVRKGNRENIKSTQKFKAN